MKAPTCNIHIAGHLSSIKRGQNQTKPGNMIGVQSPSAAIFVEPSQSAVTDLFDH